MIYIAFEAKGHKSQIFTNLQGLTEALIIGQFLLKMYQKSVIAKAKNFCKWFFKHIWLNVKSNTYV